ncbi:hypothetical protein BH20ACI2_BH20ACI2_07410 [soil metagenome]
MSKISCYLILTLFSLSSLLGCTSSENTNSYHANTNRENLDSYRANIGKTAFNATNGVEIGKIVDVEVTQINGIEHMIYKVNNGGRIRNHPVSNVIVKDVPSTVAKDPKPITEGAKVDSTLENVASEFRSRLAYYDGQILSLMLSNDRINAEWSSRKCDYLTSEIIDLAVSIIRGYSGTVGAIGIKRTCDSTTNKITISGSKFSQYKSGQIGDPQLLEGIQ